MNRSKTLSLLLVLLLAVLSLVACSGPKNRCTINCGGGNATVSFTLVADTLPANPSILSFKVSIVGIALTPTTGAAVTLTPATPVVDLMRLQSDTAFLGTLTNNVPSGTYTVQVTLTSQEITFLNDTLSSITANGTPCAAGAVCTATLAAAGTPSVASFTFNATSGGKQGIELDFNLKNAITLSNGTLSVNFNPASPNPGVFSAFILPRTNANLGTNQLELIEDFTGVVSISGNNVTVTSNTRGALTATSTSASFFDPSPDNAHCVAPASFTSCVAKGQIASVDAFLKSDGTFDLKEFEPLNQTQQDFVEGIVYAVNTTNQFTVAVTDEVLLATNSLISGLNVGDRLTVKIGTQPFLVDTKGLGVSNCCAAEFQNFNAQTTTSAIHPGQTVSVHVSAFTAANPPTLAIATVDTVILRWSRFRANVVSTTPPNTINIDALPTYFGTLATPQEVVQAFLPGALGTDGVTNLDGVAGNTSGLTPSQPVGLRVLYLQNPATNANPAFFAAKIRQP
jgi:hypothetical protein